VKCIFEAVPMRGMMFPGTVWTGFRSASSGEFQCMPGPSARRVNPVGAPSPALTHANRDRGVQVRSIRFAATGLA
jgi:hypothetical protein